MDSINVLMSVNKAFLRHTEQMMFSLLHYSSKYVNLYLMYQEKELSQSDLASIGDFVSKTNNGKLIPVKFETPCLDKLPITLIDGSSVSKETYARLFCPFKLPESVNKILYLDADMVVTGDIKELYDVPFDGNTWIACRDFGINIEDLDRLGLPHDYPYINAGMLVINVEKLRKNFTEDKMANLILDNVDVLAYLDQDFINKIFEGDIKVIDSKYNALVKNLNYKDLKQMPLILHYAGEVKPWHDNVSRFDREFVEPYYDSLRFQGDAKKDWLNELLAKHKVYGYK